jgi:hypothetical protein
MRRYLPLLLLTIFLPGCGYVSGPRPPLANIPQAVSDLAVVERGANLVVTFSTPTQTTELVALHPGFKLDLRIGGDSGAFDLTRWTGQATQVPEPPRAGGQIRYEIPAAPWAGKDATIAVRTIGSNGKPSEWSNLASLHVVAPLNPPTALRAEAVAEGVALTWQSQAARFRLWRSGEDGKSVVLAEADAAHLVDTSTEYGKPYHYEVQALAAIAPSKFAESERSAAVSITPEDKFPPAVPGGLRAATAPGSIELAWDASAESDLAGFRVYRAAPGGEFTRLAETTTPNYSDHTAGSGQAWRYAVSSFDRVGNESARSAPVESSVPR